MLLLLLTFFAIERTNSSLIAEDPTIPVKIIIRPSPSYCYGVLVTYRDVLTGSLNQCIYQGEPISAITLVLGNSTRKGTLIRPFRYYLQTEPEFPSLRVITANYDFFLITPPLPINIGELSPGCDIRYYPEDDQGNIINSTQTEIVDPMPFMQCSREYNLVRYEMELCAEVSASGQSAGLGSPMFCDGTLTAIKVEVGCSGAEYTKRIDIYMRLNFAEWWFMYLSSGIDLKILISPYESEKSLGNGAWIEFNFSSQVKSLKAMLILNIMFLLSVNFMLF